MRNALIALTLLVCLVMMAAAGSNSPASLPQYTSDNQLLRPDNYRDWVFLSSGLGMSYNPHAMDEPMFTNTFVPQWAYEEFMKSGKWPDKSMFVVEERGSQTKGSINKAGHFQTDLMGIGVEVKDARFTDHWAYFNFDEGSRTASANPKPACWQCHEDHAAVEHTFVQFYPTLKPVAKKFGVYRQERETVQ